MSRRPRPLSAPPSLFGARLRSLAAALAGPSVRRRHGFSAGEAACESLEDRKLMTAGYYDPSFGYGGKMSTYFDYGGSDDDMAAAVAVDGQGRTYVVGTVARANGDYDMAVTRYLSNGLIDTSYGYGGKAIIYFDLGGTRSDIAADIAIDRSGRAVVVGTAEYGSGDTDYAIARLTTSGQLDTTFSGDGKATVWFDLGGSYADSASAVTIDAWNRIVVAGTVDRGNYNYDFGVTRLNENGSLDTTFGAGGRSVVAFNMGGNNNDQAADVTFDPWGRIVVAGTAQVRHISYWTRIPTVSTDNDFAVARLTYNGQLDTTFSGDGRATVRFDRGGSRNDVAAAVATDSWGRVTVAGSIEFGGGDWDFGVTRLTAAGNVDTTFGYNGETTVAFDLGGYKADFLNDMAIDAQGRIVLVGTVDHVGYNTDIGTTRLTADGQIDYSFGYYGRSVAAFDRGINTDAEFAAGVAIAPSGRIVIAASFENYDDYDFGLVGLLGS